MAVQKSRKSRSRTGKKRASAYKLGPLPALSHDQETGETHLRHHISPNGYYRGRQVLKKESTATADNE